MVATIGQMASAEYYLESQRSFRHPNEYYTAGEEPDGAWFNPKGLFGLEDGVKVDSGQFQRLYNGFAPDETGKLVRGAGGTHRSPGIDMTFSVDKSVSALWAIAEPEMRLKIEAMATTSARAALEDTVLRYCSYTRVSEDGVTRPAEADLIAATFVHGTSRENDPQLHVHCTIFNLARTHEDGEWRAHHQYPVYSWKKAAGAMFRANMAWELQQGLGVHMEQYGPANEFTRIACMPDDLKAFWSKRRKAIVAMAGELGIPALGNASRMAGVNKITREGKSHDNDPEVRHRRWRGEAEGFCEREELIASVTGHEVMVSREAIRELTDRLDDLPAHLAREEAVFRRPDMVEAAANAAAGLLGREAVGTAIERLRRNPEIERLEPKKPTAESRAGMVHTEVYSTRHNLGLEQAVKDMAGAMAADTGHGLPEEAVREKVETLLADGYPLSQEQSLAIRHATMKGGRVAVIEGAAGSGKTTTLRPITDLHKEHGYGIVPTAVAWRTAVTLGDDCDARAYCVDKLLKLAAKGQVEIGAKTLIVVDEAGMLSTRQAHHILQLSERHGAKVVFAGDTRQQQPVEAGPGLRLIRDVAGSVRVDRIRRQKADLEDVLVHVHKETPEQARFRAGLTNPQERDAILAGYEAMERKPVFTPWQVAVSEALRDGEAEKAIEAWHLRNRLHLCHDEEKTLTRLVDDWERHVRTRPGTSTVVLARTKAEGRALSWLMRQRLLAQTPDAKRAVIEVSRDLDGRLTEPLEIAVGDRIRIGATQWEKQLFNGTVVTVEGIEVKRAEKAAVSRKARNRQAGGAAGRAMARGPGSKPGDESEAEPSVHITARTDDGRRVAFRHDEIRDWHDNIRLDYGYAMTIASAQGLTVDRAFLLVDDRPARETIYPAATRHREALDVYVNRAPLAFDIAEHWSEDEADMPVTDSDVRAYLAERWSRSVPKEAALDYVSGGMWRDAREEAPRHGRGGREAQRDTAEAHEAANDNALVRIAQDIRHAVNGWRHGAAVDAFAVERSEVMASWDELRARVRDEGDAVALSPAFRETLDRHGALMKQAASFRARPRTFERLLSERAGIADGELQELRDVHARAGSYLRSAAARAARPARQDAEGKSEQARRDGEPAPEPARQTASAAETARADPPAAQTSRDTDSKTAPVRPAAPEPTRNEAPEPDLSRAAYRWLRRDWGAHLGRAESQGEHRFDLDGAAALVERIAAFAGSKALAAETRARLGEIVGDYRAHAAARDRVRGFLRDVERHWLRYHAISQRARNLDIDPQEQRSWPIWLDRNEGLLREGRTIIDDLATYRAHLDRIEDGHERLGTEVSRMERFSSAYRSTQSRSRDRGPSRSL
ncbi:MAG: relaxase domain-containing protein [Rhodospirillales bacterium]|nr:relaxase domain-containing protein [Rhodospirillales bacterium]